MWDDIGFTVMSHIGDRFLDIFISDTYWRSWTLFLKYNSKTNSYDIQAQPTD
jgi:hypothetical protein